MQGPSYVLVGRLSAESRRGVRATGPDTERFIQGTISGDVRQAHERAVSAAMLTVKGKVVHDLVVVGEEQALWLWIPTHEFDAAVERLERHVIMDDVSFDASEAKVAAVVLDPTWSTTAPEVVTRSCAYPATGVWIQGEPEAVEAALKGLPELSYEAWTRHRIAEGVPAWSTELVADVFPPEVGFVQGVSYDKGCFMGQEPLARIHARGQVNRVLVRCEVSGLPREDSPLPWPLAHDERADAGRLTSLARGDGAEAGVALAVVRRSFAEEGATLSAPNGAQVRVCSGPLGDDTGVGGRHHRG